MSTEDGKDAGGRKPRLRRVGFAIASALFFGDVSNSTAQLRSDESGLEMQTQPGLQKFLAWAPAKDKERASRFAELLKSSPDLWKYAFDFARTYSANPSILGLLYEMDSTRLNDSNYRKALLKYVEGPDAKDMEGMGPLRPSVDEVFVLAQTGKTYPGLIQSDTFELLRLLQNPKIDPTLAYVLGSSRSLNEVIFSAPILRMNQLHTSSPNEIMSVVKDLNARTLCKVMVTGGSRAYLSTFKLL
jgi:hypothetical protein